MITEGAARPDHLTRVLIVDDHGLFTDALRFTLADAGYVVVDVVSDGARALQAAASHRPHLAILDLHLPDCDGIELGRRLLSENPGLKALMVTGYPDQSVLKRALRAGFHGFLSKDASMKQFIESVGKACEGSVVIPRRLVSRAASALSEEEREAALRAQQLTRRERDVLRLLVSGASSSQIARELGISLNTVRTHVQNVLTKLQVRSRLEAAAFANRYGVVEQRPPDLAMAR